MAAEFDEEEERLIFSCLLANEDPDAGLIEQEWDEIRDTIAEPWVGRV